MSAWGFSVRGLSECNLNSDSFGVKPN